MGIDMSDVNTIVTKIATEVVKKDNIINYLNVVKNNLNLSTLNQALVYLQNPKASKVCGRKAWEDVDRTVKANSVPIVLYFPNIKCVELPEEFKVDGVPQAIGNTDVGINIKDSKFESNYIPVNAFDFSSTTGKDLDVDLETPSFSDTIIEITDCVIEMVNPKSLNGEKGKYDKNTNTFYIADYNLDTDYGKEEYNRTCLELYIEYVFDNYNIKDKSLKFAVQYVVYEHFNIKHNIEEPSFMKLDKKSTKEKINFLIALNFLTSGIIQDFDGYILNFDETAIVNSILTTSDTSELWVKFENVASTINDTLLQDEIHTLKSRLSRSIQGFLDDLVVLRNAQKIFTYPPKKMQLDKQDYLREDRYKYLSEVVL